MESKELSLLKRIKIQSRRKLNTMFVGEYHSAFKGQGLSFESVREYQYGDDVKNVDWNVTARMNHLYIKEYIEERDLSIVLLVDLSGSTEFGSQKKKSEVVFDVVTLFLYLAQMNNDSISVILFTDQVEKMIKPRKGRKFILKVLDEMMKCNIKQRGTNISSALDFTRKVVKKRSVVFLISDFLTEDNYQLKLKLLSRKHDVIPVQIFDPMEKEMKIFGLTEFFDLETGKTFLSEIAPGASQLPTVKGYEAIVLNTNEPIDIPILKFFERRNRTTHLRER